MPKEKPKTRAVTELKPTDRRRREHLRTYEQAAREAHAEQKRHRGALGKP